VYAVSDTLTDPLITDPQWSSDGRRIYFKSQDDVGRSSFWSVALPNGRPRLLVRFDDPARPSFRQNFATDGKRFYFAINDRQSDIWVADVARK
jgi:Tol biopolymer transport system component